MSQSDVSDIGVFYLCGVSESGKGCKQLESFYARSTAVTEAGIRMAIQCLAKLQFLDSKHLSRANAQLESGRVLSPKAFLKSCVIGHTGYLSLVFVVESHDILKQAVTVNTGSVIDLDSIVDVRMELPRQLSMRNLSFADEAVQFLMKFGRGVHKVQLTNVIETDTFSLISTCPLLRTVNLYRRHFQNSTVPRPRLVPQHVEKCRIVSEDNLGYEQLLETVDVSKFESNLPRWMCFSFR